MSIRQSSTDRAVHPTRSLLSAITRCALLLAAAGLGACASNSATEDQAEIASRAEHDAAQAAAERRVVPVVNAYCPVAGDHPVGERGRKETTADLTRIWHGQRIGFCCDGCPGAWDDMSEADRSAALGAALDLEERGGRPGAGEHQ
jgi:hypothetical protein